MTSTMDRAASAGAGALYPPASLGVMGSGQLGRMFIQAAQRMGYRAGVLSEAKDTPAAQVAHWTVIGAADEVRTLHAFASRSDAITFEFENVPAAALRWLARRHVVRPGWRTLWICQNRLREKRFLAQHNLPHARWHPVYRASDLQTAAASLGLPLLLKSAVSGYDGKGQVRVTSERDLPGAWSELNRQACVAEAWVDFAYELSIVVARGLDGHAVCFPLALNCHEHHILDTTLMPAPVGPVVTREARLLGLHAALALGTVGVVTVEFFLTAAGDLLVNEIAPRPHNSGHLTIEAAQSSQFEHQVRALCGLPLGATDLLMPAAMVNLLGDLWIQAGGEPNWKAALEAEPGVSLHLYGKSTPAPGRKMGHLTVLDDDPERALRRALAARRALVGATRTSRST
jgi:5-(carboxyamino)imidazole ribonucleotide synthase